jgi:hypothetical protein
MIGPGVAVSARPLWIFVEPGPYLFRGSGRSLPDSFHPSTFAGLSLPLGKEFSVFGQSPFLPLAHARPPLVMPSCSTNLWHQLPKIQHLLFFLSPKPLEGNNTFAVSLSTPDIKDITKSKKCQFDLKGKGIIITALQLIIKYEKES